MTPHKSAERCEHHDFAAEVAVYRITKGEDGPVKAYEAEIRIRCAACGLPFQFVGVEPGLSGNKPMASVDFQELRAPLVPNGEHVEGLGMGFRIRYGGSA